MIFTSMDIFSKPKKVFDIAKKMAVQINISWQNYNRKNEKYSDGKHTRTGSRKRTPPAACQETLSNLFPGPGSNTSKTQ